MHLQHIEGSPATPEQAAMFEKFEREGWSHERRTADTRERFLNSSENLVELSGIEPLTSCMPCKRSPS